TAAPQNRKSRRIARRLAVTSSTSPSASAIGGVWVAAAPRQIADHPGRSSSSVKAISSNAKGKGSAVALSTHQKIGLTKIRTSPGQERWRDTTQAAVHSNVALSSAKPWFG